MIFPARQKLTPRLHPRPMALTRNRLRINTRRPPPSSPRSSPSSPPVPSPPQNRRPPSPQRTSSQNNTEGDFDPNGAVRNRRNYFGILQLPITATEREIKVQYRRLARIYHPDKYDGSTNPMTKDQVQEYFKLIKTRMNSYLPIK